MSGKRTAEFAGLEEELEKLMGGSRCDVCFVPIGSAEQATKHYGGKIHAKKVERWKEQWVAQKRIKLEAEKKRLTFASMLPAEPEEGWGGREREAERG